MLFSGFLQAEFGHVFQHSVADSFIDEIINVAQFNHHQRKIGVITFGQFGIVFQTLQKTGLVEDVCRQ